MKIEELEKLHIDPKLIKAVQELCFEELTDIQQRTIPEILKGKDIVGQSKTGSGKTAAFGLPLLNKTEFGKGIQALILTPTRELCVQVTDALQQFSKYKQCKIIGVFGGVGIEPQIHNLRRCDIVVGTPGRILDHIGRRTISFHHLHTLVLDEADKMADMGFIEDVERIIKNLPRERQTLLFSATMPSAVQHLLRKYLRDPVVIKTHSYVDKALLRQVYYNVKTHEKFSLLVHFLKAHSDGLSLIFCATRREVDIITRNLKNNTIKVMAIHGGLTQSKRLHALESLKNEHINVLVATDVAARGLDIKNVTHVYNYDVPKTSDEYVHRIGRTARAGMEGDAITLLTERDHDNFRRVLHDRTLDIQAQRLPEFHRVQFQKEFERTGFGSRFGRRPQHRGYGQQRHYSQQRRSFSQHHSIQR